MELKIIWIRHGMTLGNQKKKYIGRTDESLCVQGIAQLRARTYPPAEQIICSPMKRCIETAALLYPTQKPIVYEDLRECDFGDFEGKNYNELNGNEAYQRWIDSGGALPFPNGEAPEAFKARSCAAFEKALKQRSEKVHTFVFVVHGGVIMSVLEKYARPQKTYYDYLVKNGGGYITNCRISRSEIELEIEAKL